MLPSGSKPPSKGETEYVGCVLSNISSANEKKSVIIIDPSKEPVQFLEPWKDLRKAVERLVYVDKIIYLYAIARRQGQHFGSNFSRRHHQAEDASQVGSPWYTVENPAQRTV